MVSFGYFLVKLLKSNKRSLRFLHIVVTIQSGDFEKQITLIRNVKEQ